MTLLTEYREGFAYSVDELFFLLLGPLGPQVGLMLALFSALGPLWGNIGASWGPSWTHVAFLARFFSDL